MSRPGPRGRGWRTRPPPPDREALPVVEEADAREAVLREEPQRLLQEARGSCAFAEAGAKGQFALEHELGVERVGPVILLPQPADEELIMVRVDDGQLAVGPT